MEDQRKKRAAIHKALLRDGTMASVFKDAMAAPMGSTKREKARRMASVMKKTLGRYDGQGGPGFPSSGVGTFVSPVQPMQYDPTMNSMVIFKAPPAPAFNDGTMSEPAPSASPVDGQGGPGDLSRLSLGNPAGVGSMGGFTLSQPGAAPQQQPQQQSASSLLTGNMPRMTNVFGQSIRNQQTGITPINQTRLSLGNPLGTQGFNYGQPQPGSAPVGGLAPAPTPQPQAAGTPQPMTGGTTPQPRIGGAPSPVIPATSPLHPDYTGEPATDDMNYTESAPGGSPSTAYPGLAASMQNAMDSGIGPSTFAYQTMNDVNALRELFPGVPDEQLPVGASLSGQIDALRNALRNEYNIDGLTEELSAKIRDGVTLEQDLKDYVRGKDEYLNEIDGMLRSAKRDALKKSGGPDAGLMNDYVNYLTVLKGRQNKRYIDFYNDSIGVYQKELDALQNQLTTATSAYTNELETRATMTQDDYNRMYTSLTEMYNAAADAPRKQMELQILEAEYIKALQDLGGTGVDAISTDWIDVFGNLKTKGVLIDSDTGTLLPQVTSLEGALDTIVSDGNTDVGGAYRILGEAISNDIGAGGGDLPGLFTKVKRYERMLSDLKSQAQDPAIMQKYGYDMTPAIDNLAQTLASRSGEAMSQYVLNNAETMRKLVKEAAGKSGWFGLGGVPERSKFVNNNSNEQMPEELVGRIYDYVATIRSADPSGSSVTSFIELPDDQFAGALSHGIGVSLLSSALGT